ncbi:MAG: acetylxylan esterase [Verrucomicrobiales bacterium]|nr:acetylxylan esterase [Verrucomicrobiales bacterium]
MRMRKAWITIGMFLALGLSSRAQDARVLARHAAATNQVKRLAAEMTSRCLEDIRTADDWARQKPILRRQLAYMLGLDPMPERSPLRAEITGTLDRPGFRIEKVVFQSRPGLYVTGNFYVPKDTRLPAPTILYLCGHSAHVNGAKTQYQDRTVWYASHGYCVLSLDTLEFGEVPGIHHGTHNLGMWSWLSLGYTPAGTEVWSAMRALDWLGTRREVATDKIGVTGISGGGAMTWYLAALDERVAVAAPSCSTYTFGSQAEHWLARGQCDCIYYHNAKGWDFPVVAALIAPRPLLITSGQRDTIFPPDGYHEVYRRGKRVYDLLDVRDSERIREVDADVGHSDPPQFLKASREWMNRWLKGDSTPVPTSESELPMETPDALACLTALPADAANFRVQDELTATVKPRASRSRGEWQRRRETLIAELKANVFHWFPAERGAVSSRESNPNAGWATRYAACKTVELETETGVWIEGRLFSPTPQRGPLPWVIYVKEPGERFYSSDLDELLPFLGRCHLLEIRPRLSELTMEFGEFSDLERTCAWVGRTVASMQVWDILRAVDWVKAQSDRSADRLVLYGKGDFAVLSLYAALFDDRVSEVILNQPPSSHRRGPALLNVLRVTDVPEVAGALAPRPLSFVGEIPPGFELTRSIYARSKGAAALRVVGSAAEAVGLR